MEAFPVKFCRSIRSYWGRRRYQRLDGGSPTRGRKTLRAKLGNNGSVRQGWRIPVRPALRLGRLRLWMSPLRLLARLRDAYVDAMVGLAGRSSGKISGSAASALRQPAEAVWGKRMPKARSVRETTSSSSKEFDRRVVIEIYKSLAASRQITTF